MATSKKHKAKSTPTTNEVRDYSNDPFVLKKNREAVEFIKKHGLPKEFVTRARQKKTN